MALGKSQKAQVHRFVADDALHPLGLQSTVAMNQGRPLQNSQFRTEISKYPSQLWPFTSLYSSFLAPRWLPLLAGTCRFSGKGAHPHVRSWTTLVFPYWCLVTLPLFLAQFFFFLSTALETSHILLTLTTQGLMLPFLLLSLALHW